MSNEINDHLINDILDRYKRAPDYDIGTRELIPSELMLLLPTLVDTVDERDPFCVLRLFHPGSRSEWLVSSPERFGSDTLLFAHVTVGGDKASAEWGDVSYRELNDINRVGGTREPWLGRVEVDILFEPCRFSQVRT